MQHHDLVYGQLQYSLLHVNPSDFTIIPNSHEAPDFCDGAKMWARPFDFCKALVILKSIGYTFALKSGVNECTVI